MGFFKGFFKRVGREESLDEYLERTPDYKLSGYALQKKKRIRYPSEYASMSHKERLEWQRLHITKPWCVCQDLNPFLIIIFSEHDSEEEARRAVSSEYSRAYRTHSVHEVNRRLDEDEGYFEEVLHRLGR